MIFDLFLLLFLLSLLSLSSNLVSIWGCWGCWDRELLLLAVVAVLVVVVIVVAVDVEPTSPHILLRNFYFLPVTFQEYVLRLISLIFFTCFTHLTCFINHQSLLTVDLHSINSHHPSTLTNQQS